MNEVELRAALEAHLADFADGRKWFVYQVGGRPFSKRPSRGVALADDSGAPRVEVWCYASLGLPVVDEDAVDEPGQPSFNVSLACESNGYSTWLSVVSELPSFLRDADLVVVQTTEEGFTDDGRHVVSFNVY